MRRLRRGLASRPLFACLLLLAGLVPVLPAAAAERDAAYGAYQTGHYRRALSEALKRIEADSNDAAAMTLVGEIYRQGLGVPPDQKVATEWYERAAARVHQCGVHPAAPRTRRRERWGRSVNEANAA